jgi:5-methylcytosine-specific restriction endonuclease McrA
LASDVSESQRRFVAERAAHRCEYCLLHEDDSYSPHQIDHIISRKHGGLSESGNLAYACLRCNAWKGSDVGSLDPETGAFVSLFHPRRHRWEDHFVLRGPRIEPITPEGKATARLLKLNLDKRVVERQLLTAAGRYPR